MMITTFQNLQKAAHHGANPYAINVLQIKRKDLIYGILNTADLLDHTVREGIFTAKKKSILAMRTRHEQNSRILDIIEANGEQACRKFIHPCLMRAEPELYYQICEYVMTVNEHIRDTRRQLIGYLLEQDQEKIHEIMKRQVSQRKNVVLDLKEISFMKENKMPQLELAITKPEKPIFLEVIGKTEDITYNDTHIFDAKTQANAELIIKPEAEDLGTTRSTEATEEQTSTQDTVGNTVKDTMNLHQAAQEDAWLQVERLVENGAQIEARDCQNKTALFYAVAEGYENTVTALLKAGAKIDYEIINEAMKHNSVLKMIFANTREAVSEEDLNSAVFSAVRQNKDTTLSTLIDNGGNINILDKQGYTPLLLSAEMGHSEVFRVLLEKQANPEPSLSNHLSVLHLAAKSGSVPIVKELLKKGLNPDITGPKAQTPLHLAATLPNPDIVQLLLETGAQINSAAQNGVTPLHVASQHGNEDIAACLLKNKTKIEAEDKHGRTALHWASIAPKESNIVSMLLSFKANVNALDNEKRSALHLASTEGKLQNVTSLLSHKAKVGAKDKNGCTPMHYAATGGHVSIVSALLQSLKKKNIDERNIWKKTPLHVAAEKGHDNVVTLLLKAGAKINSTDQNKDTPLHCAVRGGHQEVVKKLVDWGQRSSFMKKADLQIINSVGKTALQLAQDGGTPEHENIAALLKRKMFLAK